MCFPPYLLGSLPNKKKTSYGMASSWAWSSTVSIAEICAVASWASPYTFVRFYNLDFLALQAQILSARACLEQVYSLYALGPFRSAKAEQIYLEGLPKAGLTSVSSALLPPAGLTLLILGLSEP